MFKKLLPILIVIILTLSGCGNGAKVKEAIADGNNAMSNKDYDAAITAFQEALNLQPDNIEAEEHLKKATDSKNFINYIEKITPISEELELLSVDWEDARTLSQNYLLSDYEFALIIMDEFVPRTREISKSAETISLEIDSEYTKAHEILIESINATLQAYTEILSAINDQDFSKITSANNYLDIARTKERQYVQELMTKSKELNIDISSI